MQTRSALIALALISNTAFADVPNIFNNGELTDADDVNQNFTYLDSQIDEVRFQADENKSKLEALNGIERKEISGSELEGLASSGKLSPGVWTVYGNHTIQVNTDMEALNNDGVTIIGASFEGNNTNLESLNAVSFYSGSVAFNVSFKNVEITGLSACYNCYFEGNVLFSNGLNIINGRIFNVTTTSALPIGTLDNVRVDDSYLPRVDHVSNSSHISDTTITVKSSIVGSDVFDSLVNLEGRAFGNHFDDSSISLKSSSGNTYLSSNYFSGTYDSQDSFIALDLNVAGRNRHVISSNFFTGRSSDTCFSISGSESGTNTFISFQGNASNQVGSLVDFSGYSDYAPIYVINNVTDRSLGNSTGRNVTVQNNVSRD